MILADAAATVPAADPRIWVEAGSRAFAEGGWIVVAILFAAWGWYVWCRYGRRKGGE